MPASSVESRSIYSGPIRRALQRLDGQINGGNNSGGHLDDRYVNIDGDTMTGNLIIANPATLSFGSSMRQMLNLHGTAYALGVQGSTVYYRTGNQFAWYRNGSHSDAGLDPGPGGTTVMRTSSAGSLVVGEGMTTVTPLVLAGPLNSCYVPFHCEGDGATTRSGYIGFPNSANLHVRNERTGGTVSITALTGPIVFFPNGSEAARFLTDGTFLVGKTTYDQTQVGFMVNKPSGRVWGTTDTSMGYNFIANILNAANGDVFYDMRRNGTRIGWIVANGTTGVLYQSASDYRLKNVLGPVVEPIERVKRLRPVHFAWKADGRKQDGFLAHEVAEVVPDAVTGDKDAVTEDGEIAPQGLDNARLVPLLVAAVQEQQVQIEQLQRRIDILERAAA
jgi:hypothetical protein